MPAPWSTKTKSKPANVILQAWVSIAIFCAAKANSLYEMIVPAVSTVPMQCALEPVSAVSSVPVCMLAVPSVAAVSTVPSVPLCLYLQFQCASVYDRSSQCARCSPCVCCFQHVHLLYS